jgi:2-dehydropantoate 2-reductase
LRFAVLGAGAIGAYVGAALARGGASVILIARGAHLRSMQANGVTVESPRGDFAVKVDATDDIAAIADADVVIVALKAYSLPEMATQIAGVLKPGALTVWAQNGFPWWYFHGLGGALNDISLQSVDPEGVIAGAIPFESVIGCVVYCSTELAEPGVIRHVEGTRFSLGEPDGSPGNRLGGISDAFVAGGLKAPVDAHLRDQIWLKLVGNVAFNPISALTRSTLGELGSLPEMLGLLKALFAESAAIATELGIDFPVPLDRRLEAGIAVGDHKTSMLQDLEAGKRLEIDCMTGAIVELGDLLGIPVPHTRSVHACAKLLDLLGPQTLRSTSTL